jgi:hypothetical protein
MIVEVAFNNNQHSQKGDKEDLKSVNLRGGRMVAWLMMVQTCQGSPTQPDWTNSPLVQQLVMTQLWMKPNHVTDGCHRHTLAVDISLTKRRIQLKLNPLGSRTKWSLSMNELVTTWQTGSSQSLRDCGVWGLLWNMEMQRPALIYTQ